MSAQRWASGSGLHSTRPDLKPKDPRGVIVDKHHTPRGHQPDPEGLTMNKLPHSPATDSEAR